MAFNPYSVMDNTFQMDGQMPFNQFMGRASPKRSLGAPNYVKNPPPNPYSFSGSDQYGSFEGGGDILLAPNQAQAQNIMGTNPVGMANPTQSVSNNPYAKMFPTFNANDIRFTPQWQTIGEGSNERTERIAGLGTLSNVRNYFPEWGDELSPNNYLFQEAYRPGMGAMTDGSNIDPNMMELLVKSGAKEGTRVPYTLQNGQWVPDYSKLTTQNWDTGNSFQNRALAMIAGGALASGMMAPTGGWDAAMGAAGNVAGSGLSGVDALIAAGEGLVPIASTSAPGMAANAAFWTPAGQAALGSGIGLEGMGAMAGAGAASDLGTSALDDLLSNVPGMTGAEGTPWMPTGAEAGLGAGGELMGPPDFLAGSNVDPYGVGSGFGGDTLPAMGVPNDTGAGVLDRLTGLARSVGNTGSAVNRLLGGAGGAAAGRAGGGNLGGLVSAIYGANAQENYADQLNRFIEEMRTNANPYLTRLQESYTNPNAYLESPEMQARLGLEANKLTGIDASKGRLSNDIQRTKLLQDYGMAALNDYRSGLRQNVQSLWDPNKVFQAQAMMGAMDAAKYSDLARFAGQSGGNWSVDSTIKDIRSVIDAGGDLWDIIKGWWS